MAEEKCYACKFWLGLDDKDKVGLCRRFPPVFNDALYVFEKKNYDPVGPDAIIYCRQPMTEAVEWCGEYRPKGDVK